MNKYVFFYINSNHTSVIIDELRSISCLEIIKLENLEQARKKKDVHKFILFQITGQIRLRKDEKEIIENILHYPWPNVNFLIVTPFSFEAGVDLKWVQQQIQKFNEKKIAFDIFELDRYFIHKRYLTFDQVFNDVKRKILHIMDL